MEMVLLTNSQATAHSRLLNDERKKRLERRHVQVHNDGSLECMACGSKWIPKLVRARLARHFWLCPNSCNRPKPVAVAHAVAPTAYTVSISVKDKGKKTTRFSISLPAGDSYKIDLGVKNMGVSRNEFMRRSALAYLICEQSNHTIPVKEAWQQVGAASCRVR